MNIDSKHVSIEGLKINDDVSNILNKYNISTYFDLNNEIEKENKEVMNNYFLRTANSDFKKMYNNQEDGKSVEEKLNLIVLKSKENVAVSDIDSTVNMYELPYFRLRPIFCHHLIGGYHSHRSKVKHKQIEISDLEGFTIADLKELINTKTVFLGEVMPALMRKDGVGEFKYNQILASLNFYDRYIDLLLREYSGVENPFYFMHDEKKRMVKENEKQIFNYLLQNGYELVLGDISKVVTALDTSIKSNSQIYKKIDNLEEIITNYVTFDEALEITSPKVLNKFIVPYGRR